MSGICYLFYKKISSLVYGIPLTPISTFCSICKYGSLCMRWHFQCSVCCAVWSVQETMYSTFIEWAASLIFHYCEFCIQITYVFTFMMCLFTQLNNIFWFHMSNIEIEYVYKSKWMKDIYNLLTLAFFLKHSLQIH